MITSLVRAKDQALAETGEKAFQTWKRKHPFTFSEEKLTRKAAKAGNLEVTKYLLSQGYGQTSFLQAADKGDMVSVETFISAGVDLETRDKYRYTPLIRAAHRKRPHIVKILLEAGANINAVDSGGNTALIRSNDHGGSVESARLLIDSGADLYVEGGQGRTALVWAEYLDCYAIISLLKEAMKKNPKPEPKKKALKATNKWEAFSKDGDDMVVHTRYAPQTKTRLKHIFDFNAQVLLTELRNGEVLSGLLEKDFSAVNPALLSKATEVLKSSPPPRPARLKKI